MPWHLDPTVEVQQSCVLVAAMDSNEMQSVSLHVLQHPHADE